MLPSLLKLSSFIIIVFCFGLGIITFYRGSWVTTSTKNNPGQYVVLLHGLRRSSWSMHILGANLAKKGYRIINVNYPSTTDTIENLANNYLAKEIERHYLDKSKQINFVTHSMGGAVVRYFLGEYKFENLNRVVMIAPPSRGAEAADIWSKDKKMRTKVGPAIDQMTTNMNSLVNQLPPPYYEVGIIAGERDEKVSIENTKLEGMKDFLLVNSKHTFIMIATEVIEASARFLQNGKF